MQGLQCSLVSVSLPSPNDVAVGAGSAHVYGEVGRGDRGAAMRLFFPTSCQHNQNNSLAPNKIKSRIPKPSFPPAVCLDPIP